MILYSRPLSVDGSVGWSISNLLRVKIIYPGILCWNFQRPQPCRVKIFCAGSTFQSSFVAYIVQILVSRCFTGIHGSDATGDHISCLVNVESHFLEIMVLIIKRGSGKKLHCSTSIALYLNLVAAKSAPMLSLIHQVRQWIKYLSGCGTWTQNGELQQLVYSPLHHVLTPLMVGLGIGEWRGYLKMRTVSWEVSDTSLFKEEPQHLPVRDAIRISYKHICAFAWRSYLRRCSLWISGKIWTSNPNPIFLSCERIYVCILTPKLMYIAF